MAFTLVRNGLMFFFALFICSFSLISCERPTVREGNSQTQKRYNELLEEVERSYSKMKLPRLNGKVGEEIEATLLDGRNVLIKRLSKRPPIFEVKNFLESEECEQLIELAKKSGLKESKTLDDIEDVDVQRMLEVSKFELWDKDKNDIIDVKEIYQILEQMVGFYCEEKDIISLIKDLKFDGNGDGVVSKGEFNDFNLSSSNALEFVRHINRMKAENPATKSRFSEQSFLSDFQDPLLEKLRERIAAFTGLPKDLVDASEDLQVVKYTPGGHYNCHLDSEEIPRVMNKCCHLGEFTGPVDSQCQLCRYMTVLYFLNDVIEGGETAFPLADNATLSKEAWAEDVDCLCDLGRNCLKSNLVVKPEKGKAVLWYNHYVRKESGWLGQVDFRSFHGGCGVVKGEKWIANNWINASPIRMEDFHLWASDRLANEMEKKGKEAREGLQREKENDGSKETDTNKKNAYIAEQSYSQNVDKRNEL